MPGSQTSVLISGETGAGKSYLAGLLAERWIAAGYSVLVIDREGDHVGLAQRPGAAAKDAAELVVVDYRPLPAVTAAVAAAAPDAQQLWDTPNVAIDAMVGDGSATEAALPAPRISRGSKPMCSG